MKKVLFYSVVAASLVLGACNQKTAAKKEDEKETTGMPGTSKVEQVMESESKTVNIKLSALATNKDLNCDMPVEEGSIADTATYKGKIYGFCSSECKVEFLKDPEAHLAKK